MRKTRFAAATLLAAALGCVALAAPKIEVPAEVKTRPGKFTAVAAKTDGKTVKWVALDSGLELFPAELLKDTKTAVVLAGKPGTYRLLAYSAAGDEPTDPAVATVTVVGDEPPPTPPGPGPTPPSPQPTPAPGQTAFWVVVVEETDARTPEIASVLTDQGYWPALLARGHLKRFYDKDSREVREKNYARFAADGVPVVILIDQKNPKHIVSFKLPDTTAELDARIKKEGGK